jgi:hypothetical protein
MIRCNVPLWKPICRTTTTTLNRDVSSIGPQLGQGGRVVRPAQIVVYPFGPDPLAAAAGKVPLLKPGMVALHLSLDEAEALAEKLIDVVRRPGTTSTAPQTKSSSTGSTKRKRGMLGSTHGR